MSGEALAPLKLASVSAHSTTDTPEALCRYGEIKDVYLPRDYGVLLRLCVRWHPAHLARHSSCSSSSQVAESRVEVMPKSLGPCPLSMTSQAQGRRRATPAPCLHCIQAAACSRIHAVDQQFMHGMCSASSPLLRQHTVLQTGRPKGFGFVEYLEEKDADDAV